MLFLSFCLFFRVLLPRKKAKLACFNAEIKIGVYVTSYKSLCTLVNNFLRDAAPTKALRIMENNCVDLVNMENIGKVPVGECLDS